MALNLERDQPLPLSAHRTVYVAAYVEWVDDGDGHLASVYYEFGATPRARLDVALRGHPEEGRVRHEIFEAVIGSRGAGLHVWSSATATVTDMEAWR